MKSFSSYSLALIFALGCYLKIGASQKTCSFRTILTTATVGCFTLSQAASTARVKVKFEGDFSGDIALVKDFYAVPTSFAGVCCSKGALKRIPDCGTEAAKIANVFNPNLVEVCCAKKNLEKRTDCFFQATKKD